MDDIVGGGSFPAKFHVTHAMRIAAWSVDADVAACVVLRLRVLQYGPVACYIHVFADVCVCIPFCSNHERISVC